MDLECLTTIECNQAAVRAVRFNVDGCYCITCGSDNKFKLWNPYRQLLLKTYGGHGNEVLDACGSCDSSHILSCSVDKTVILWDVSTGQPIRRLRGHAASVTCVKFNEESTVAVSGSLDNTVMFWDLKSRSNAPIQILNDATDCITSVRVTDHEIYTGSVDCSARRYDLRTAMCETDFTGAPVTSLSLTHDGQCLLVGSGDSTIRLLDKNTGEMLGEYTGHSTGDMKIESEVMTNDNYVISGSATGKLYVWDLVSAEGVRQFTHTPNKVLNSVSVHPRKDIILTACVTNIKVWGQPGSVASEMNDATEE